MRRRKRNELLDAAENDHRAAWRIERCGSTRQAVNERIGGVVDVCHQGALFDGPFMPVR